MMSDRQWVPEGGELDKPRWLWSGNLDSGKSDLSHPPLGKIWCISFDLLCEPLESLYFKLLCDQ